MENKIILGSANFDQKYGISRNFILKSEIKKLFKSAKKNKITTVDTSPSYNKSEKIIGSLNEKNFKIISKTFVVPKNLERKKIKSWMKKKSIISLKNLKIKKFECLLIHDANSLLGKNGNEIYEGIKEIKKSKLTNKIGVSIYDFYILGKILKKFKFDTIQAPYNILDQRLVKTGWLKKLKRKKIEIHVRSIFLQGILLLKPNQLPNKLKKLKKSWFIWEQWLKRNKFNPMQVCMSFVFQQRQINGFVVGFNNVNQLNQILKFRRLKNNFSIPNLGINNKNLIDPRKWNK